MKKIFTSKLIDWHMHENKRIMPWKGEKDPYKIWISEIILQQTRVEQGLAYYNNFVKEFPTLRALALASDEAVFKAWEGLGYYSRCKNLLFTARYVYKDLGGKFPSCYENLLKLKGIGPYTASAISSFAYGLPHAVVDGNVFRVLARYFGEAAPIDSSAGKQLFTALANRLLYQPDSAAYNQAIMDFGAIVCRPQTPDCQRCPLNSECVAFSRGLVNKLPVKEKALVKRNRFFTYFVFSSEDKILVMKRLEKDIWQNLYEFYLLESESEREWKSINAKKWIGDQLGCKHFTITGISGTYTQKLTHQNLKGKFVNVHLAKIPISLQNLSKVTREEMKSLPFPKFINSFLETVKERQVM
jgi:A/G-specific adenine glycosylase